MSFTFWNNPSFEERFKNLLRRFVRDEVEVDRVTPVEEDALDQRHHAAGVVEAGAHDADLKDLALRNT